MTCLGDELHLAIQLRDAKLLRVVTGDIGQEGGKKVEQRRVDPHAGPHVKGIALSIGQRDQPGLPTQHLRRRAQNAA
jgi:hypothetical protein